MKSFFAGLLLVMGLCLLSGCQTSPANASRHMAQVTLQGCSEANILRAAQKVFARHGYQHVSDLDFDKKGSFYQTFLYGGWGEGGVWIRMKASLDPDPEGGFTLGCDAFRVTEHDNGVMEEEHPAGLGYHSECVKILQEIQAALQAPATGANPS